MSAMDPINDWREDWHDEMDGEPDDRLPIPWWCYAIAIIAGLILVFAWFGEAEAHEAPTGWSYPFACCSNYDCRTVGDGRSDKPIRVYETAEGYRISSTGEVIPMTDNKVRQSPDGLFHWCSVAGKDDSKTICLFVPPRAF